MSGEGRGHATRVRAVTEALRAQHEVRLFAPGDAHALLSPLYAGTDVRVDPIPGLRFSYKASHRLDYSRTAVAAWRYFRGFGGLVGRLTGVLRNERPDLVITDFEPALPRAARRCGIPFISLNHQHFLRTYDLRTLPFSLRWHAAYMGAIVGLYHRGQVETIVSSFYFPPLRPGTEHVTQVGVLLRSEVEQATATDGDHLVAYWRRFAPGNVIEALANCGREVRIYGLGEQPPRGRLRFRPISSEGFLSDLATGAALICTAGNQLVGEALHLGKPVLALPEPANYEQYINAHFLRQGGAGDWIEMKALNARIIGEFLPRLAGFRRRIDRARMDGLPETLRVLRRHLPRKPAPIRAETLALA